MKLKHRFKGIRWKRGGGELIGFAICLPMIMLVISGIILILQLGLAKQKLEYAAYSAARAAVVQENMGRAQLAASEAAMSALETGTIGINRGGVTVALELVAGRTHHATGDVGWQKGALLKVIVTADVNTIAPFLDRRMGTEIVMMVEFPVSSGALPPP